MKLSWVLNYTLSDIRHLTLGSPQSLLQFGGHALCILILTSLRLATLSLKASLGYRTLLDQIWVGRRVP